jgi:hypothetical protein
LPFSFSVPPKRHSNTFPFSLRTVRSDVNWLNPFASILSSLFADRPVEQPSLSSHWLTVLLSNCLRRQRWQDQIEAPIALTVRTNTNARQQ